MGGNAMQPLANVTMLKTAADKGRSTRAGAIRVEQVGQIYKAAQGDVVALTNISLEV